MHYTRGICPETGKRIVAKGVIGIGRLATGVLAIGQASFGVVAVGQLGLGLLLGLGQGSTGWIAIGQLAIGVYFGLGWLRLASGKYVLAQMGFGEHVWSTKGSDPEAIEFFKHLLSRFL